MTNFTHANTEGFSDDELKLLNTVAARLQNWFPGVDGKNITDSINNAFEPGIDEEALYFRSARSLSR